ncbi:MAG: HEAT repeat domain-containing protein [Clostridiales bacterium]|jgi:DNA modification methylase|nr:HEAT repeat domain-containing protein [Clostridiales bacterium]
MTQNHASQIIFSNLNQNLNTNILIDALTNLGNIQEFGNVDPIKKLLSHTSAQVRVLALKQLAKIDFEDNDKLFIDTFYTDEDTLVRREAISSLGRQRYAKNKMFLLSVLEDSDPKIVCQAIRALFVFKGHDDVQKRLRLLVDHDNEMVRQIINKEFFSNDKKAKNTKQHCLVDDNLSNVVVLGDVLEILQYVDREQVHLTFTSPPYYNARDYSIYKSYDNYLDFLKIVFEQVHRITKEGRFLVVNTSPVIVPRMSRQHSSKRYPIPFDLHAIISKLGWEFVDDIVWEKPEYSVKNRVGGFEQHRKPLGYKPNTVTEYLMVYRKQTDKLLDWNIHQYTDDIVQKSKVVGEYETTNVWKIHPKSDKVHSAIFPKELCQRVIEYYSYVGDLVFDPFAGSGTVGRVSKFLNRKFFLTEKERTYFNYMQKLMPEQTLIENDSTKFLTLEEFAIANK